MNKLKWTSEILGKKVFMEAEFERIGKVRAKELLANQVGSQRVVQRAFVDRLKEAMANDEYIEDVINPIFISDTGKLLEGQHRLNAIADSEDGTSINFLVVRGLPEKAFVYLDQNRTRDAKDSLRIKGIRNPQKTAAASKLLYQLIYGKTSKPRNEIVDRMVDDYPALGEAVSLAESFSKKLHIKIAKYINKSKINKTHVYGNYTKHTFNKLKPEMRGKILNNKLEILNLIK